MERIKDNKKPLWPYIFALLHNIIIATEHVQISEHHLLRVHRGSKQKVFIFKDFNIFTLLYVKVMLKFSAKMAPPIFSYTI